MALLWLLSPVTQEQRKGNRGKSGSTFPFTFRFTFSSTPSDLSIIHSCCILFLQSWSDNGRGHKGKGERGRIGNGCDQLWKDARQGITARFPFPPFFQASLSTLDPQLVSKSLGVCRWRMLTIASVTILQMRKLNDSKIMCMVHTYTEAFPLRANKSFGRKLSHVLQIASFPGLILGTSQALFLDSTVPAEPTRVLLPQPHAIFQMGTVHESKTKNLFNSLSPASVAQPIKASHTWNTKFQRFFFLLIEINLDWSILWNPWDNFIAPVLLQ